MSARGGLAAPNGGETGKATGRAQTTIDYAVGVSLFLLTVAFVFAFTPSLISPFASDASETAVVADRAADRLAADLLAESPAHPAVLNETCTTSFFDTGDTDPPGCRYDADADDLAAALGVDDAVRRVNVTIAAPAAAAGAVHTLDGVDLAAGPAPPRSADVSTARRSVLLDGRQWRLAVRVW